jgi:hypothetical protein
MQYHQLLSLMADLSVTAAIICDDVRKEAGGKDILIGVYGGGVLVPSFPCPIQFAIWIELAPQPIGRLEVDLQARFPGNPMGLGIRFVAEVSGNDDPVVLHTPQFVTSVSEPGNIEVSIKRPNEEEWRVVKTKRVLVGEPQPVRLMRVEQGTPPDTIAQTSSTASPLPSEQSPSDAQATKPARARRRPSSRRSARTPAKE